MLIIRVHIVLRSNLAWSSRNNFLYDLFNVDWKIQLNNNYEKSLHILRSIKNLKFEIVFSYLNVITIQIVTIT